MGPPRPPGVLPGVQLVPMRTVIPSLIASCAIAYACWDLTRNRHLLGGTCAKTYADKDWEEETLAKFDSGWPREAGPPCVMNPIRRQNFTEL
ncbi:hypothetical protein MPTK1_3g21270 [Marchantia polymorpha subsp. ruderalis]|uniref:Uncharacterized protein n=2 Tax=Marchantia polymorpha TaxID=3197 RepID=A0AAF6B368_MARPO|nr:hypothetical protein MARPO_0160s0022 [Marchantia polymorpha]BBN06452.1 hypothetical protein Mp_3g21270 [Marchantia polymorpha subsp. ruderalis]|eukprot:PTQ28572.1 hypothetical protein MARPO_0160s0022 [Marchantia polymorpha]